MSRTGADVIVVGSGAGGAVTALVLAEAGLDVLVLEEGGRFGLDQYGAPAPIAMQRLYRRRGMTPIVGRVPIGYVEGACVGGSTEINSGFWHRAPRETLTRWASHHGLAEASEDELAPHYAWAEGLLGVGPWQGPWPKSTELFARGIEKMGWSYQEVPRAAPGCKSTNRCAQGCPTGAKQGMSRSLLPAAERAGARIASRLRVIELLRRGTAVRGVLAERRTERSSELIELEARAVVVCAGPSETPALLQKSGLRYHVGSTFKIHPYLKLAARFPEAVDAAQSVLPLLQVKEFSPELSLGGAFFSSGQLAMLLSDQGPRFEQALSEPERWASFYVGVRGKGQGSVRPHWLGEGTTEIRYELDGEDVRQLGVGLARLGALLLAAGATEVVPSVRGLGPLRTEAEAARFLDDAPRATDLGLVTVHAFSSCPAGERADRSAVDSFGRVRDAEALYVNDASMLPDSPGVNPQGTVMALAHRNAERLAAALARR